MSMELRCEYRFESAHYLPHVPEGHMCGGMHGHSYKVELTIAGELDPRLGWVIEFSEIDAAWQVIHKQIDHKVLNEVPGLENPTAEVFAIWIYKQLNLPRVVKLRAVTVHETAIYSATYRPD